MRESFSRQSYHGLLEALARKDARLQRILDRFGYPPFWSRQPGFPGLVRIILEQQVSLASALHTWNRLEEGLGRVTPRAVLARTDQDLADLGITRQKRSYIRGLAAAFQDPAQGPALGALETLPDDQIRAVLTAVRGIGPWTADIYLIMGLHRRDVFPAGDLALNKALDTLGILPLTTPSRQLFSQLAAFAPFRSLLACLLWHWYIQSGSPAKA